MSRTYYHKGEVLRHQQKRYADSKRDDERFVDSIVVKLPRNWANTARAQHAIKAKTDCKAANLWLLDLNDAIQGAIDIGATDSDLILLSVDLVARVRTLMSENTSRVGATHGTCGKWLHEKLEKLCVEYSVRYPIEHDRSQILARLSDSAWWVRCLRVAHNKRAEGAAIDAGMVSKRGDVYVSDDTLERRTSQRKRNIETLKSINMANTETGEVMNLGDIVAAGTGNHESRRAELVTRVRGFEELSNKYGHSAEFVTVTCPSRMHAVLANGKANPKYDGTKPDMAQKYLVENWARVRAVLAKNGVRFYGLRIAEPHHDATPHWHLILFYRKSETLKREIREAFRAQYIYDSEFESLSVSEQKDRKENGLEFVAINKARGTASGYVLKYVLKNIGGIKDEKSDESTNHSSETLYERVEAWASCWRIRQFQQIGGHYVSVWRELRRVDECKMEGMRPAFVKTWQACQKVGERKADFASFIEGMGGLDTPPRKSLYQVMHDYLTVDGKYGKTIVAKILGVNERFGFEVVATNRAKWVTI